MSEVPSFLRENIRVAIDGAEHEVPRGIFLHDFLQQHGGPVHKDALAGTVNNRLYGRAYPLKSDCTIQPVTRADRLGWDVYRRSACLMLHEAARRVDPDLRLVLSQTVGDGYYYYAKNGQAISTDTVRELEQKMKELTAQALPFRVVSMSVIEARRLLSGAGYHDKVHLLNTHWEPKVRLVWCGEFFDLFHAPVVYSTADVHHYRFEAYSPGMVLRFPVRGQPDVKGQLVPQPKLFATYLETRRWNEILGVSNLGELNATTLAGDIGKIVQVAEGFQEKKIASIADEICRRKELRLALIAGPSSSGKTTLSKRLGVQLRVNGVRPVSLSLDDFFVERARTPKDSEGKYDFEAIEAIDLDLLGETLSGLMKGEQVSTPIFDFHAGAPKPRDEWRPMRLEKDQILVIEGIHGLNNRLTETVAPHAKYKIYISALTQLCIDDHSRIFTSDTRMLRRVVRDRRYRGYSAAETIMRWPSVRRGENRNIFPYQEQADVMFNSALVYEHAVIKPYAERYLLEVPQDHPAFVAAYRLLRFLKLIVPVFGDVVPHNSIVREFIGESAFQY